MSQSAENSGREETGGDTTRQGSPSRPLNRTELAVWLGFLSTHLKLLRTLDTELLAAERISMSSFEVLLTVAEAPEGRIRMKDIAASLLISRSGLTRIVDDLQRQGLVVREKCPTDARGFDAVLTAAGRKAYRRANKVHLTNLRKEFLDKLTDDQLTELAGIWATVGFDENANTC
ncbi:MarR family transcriptional regulator [Streptomyces sp. NBC_01724]|uniref:MarR family winged helix-turn-helix transcriptional regulator n=1 Tax=unclassified Streptomyces TaxID=2593676 RepID=UPI002E31D9CC|nr:MarR family transcriptional regulator [Streptomyces sp. NBC_01724]WTE57386.1 MarR family transcriptional regulator [Streptomyces sp. NBC_01617]WTE64742.1 MarR family transcriptional regulator [Streptomyces sp. NBC_01617]